jgi:hypothetical protein
MDSLNFHSLSFSALDEQRQALNLDMSNTELMSCTPDFVAMCDLLSDDFNLNLILSEDV